MCLGGDAYVTVVIIPPRRAKRLGYYLVRELSLLEWAGLKQGGSREGMRLVA